MHGFLIILMIGISIDLTDGSCTFPANLNDGVWISADKGPLTITGTSILAYPVAISGVSSFDFDCIEQSGTTFLFQAQQFQNVFGTITRFFLCLDIHEVNGNVYKYFRGTDKNIFIDDFIFPLAVDIATIADACNIPTPYVPYTYIPLIKNGSIADGSASVQCPDDVLAVFNDVTITDGGVSESCTNSVLDVCTNRTQMNFTLETPCTTIKTFSNDGKYTCLHYITSGQTTYLSLWNNDAAPTYQFTCFAFRKTGTGTVSATETAKYCSNGTTYLIPGTQDSVQGKNILVTSTSETCIDVVTVPVEDTTFNTDGLYALSTIPLYILLTILVLLIVLFCKRPCCNCKKKQKPEKTRPESPIVVAAKPETSNAKFGMRGELYMKRSSTNISLFRSKKSVVIPSHPSFLPCVLPLPRVEPIYKDPFLLQDPSGNSSSQTSVEQQRPVKPPSSPGIGGLYSFDAVPDIM